jgi:hypothetical protein
MGKIQTVVLKNMRIVKTEDGYEKEYFNEQQLPAVITNYSLSMGEKLGLISGSQLSDLGDIQELFRVALNPRFDLKKAKKALKDIDINKYLKVIYLAVLGGNPQLKLTFEDFTSLYHEDTPTIIDTYTNLILSTLTEEVNKFAEGFQKSIKKK